MTWAKFSTEYPDECVNADLSDSAFRLHTEALMWLYRMESFECLIAKRLVPRFAGTPLYEGAIKELIDKGFWREVDGDYYVMHSREVVRQGLTAQLAKRATNRKAQAKHRAKVRAEVSTDVSDDVSPDVSPGVSDATTNQPTTQAASDGRGVQVNGSADIWPDPTPIHP